MGNCFRKPSNPKLNYSKKAKLNEFILEEVPTRASIDHGNQEILDINTRLHYPKLDDTRTNKLNKLLDKVVTKASIDYGNQEIRDIQTAVHTMLERVVTRVNERGMFKISRIVPCGSMVEQTAVLKFDYEKEMYTEFDFLGNLEYSPNIICLDHGCGQCVKVSGLPVPVEARSKLQEYDDKFLRHYWFFRRIGTVSACDHLFWREVNTCLGSDCQCFSVQYNDIIAPSYSYKLAAECESDYRCDKCVVEMPTGILRVNHSVSVGKLKDANCSFVLMWTSKANTLPVYDSSLQNEARQVTSLPIHVDFLPALEVRKDKPDEPTHDFFLVPKHCNVCDDRERWRKSNCMAEIAYIVKEMSKKHRKCYKIIKYFLSTEDISRNIIWWYVSYINWYYVKTVALNHSRECSDSSEGCAECVLKILTDLQHAYETKKLTSFHESGVDIFCPREILDPDTIKNIIQNHIKRLCSATDIVQF